MKRTLMALMLLACSAGAANAQITKAIGRARNAKAAVDAHTAREQGEQPTGRGTPAAKQPQGTTPRGAASTRSAAAPPKGKAATDTVPTVIMREAFAYDRANARDPFFSLLNTSELRPVISDLHLIGILYDVNGRRSVAVMRGQDNTLYRARVGQVLGRMRVAQIKPRTVIFTIEEFGANRQDSLVLADTTKGRNP